MKSGRLDYLGKYQKLVGSLIKNLPFEEAMRTAPGGLFDFIGIVERELLIQTGLRSDDYLIDVGCGSGRLAKPLSEYLTGKYLGIDIVPELVKYARQLVQRKDWRFELAQGVSIPEKDHQAHMVCFFSVFTHLFHEHSYVYLQEARRVLRPGGKIVFSFLDYTVNAHWPIFESTVARTDDDAPPNVFIGRDAINAWASHLDLQILAIEDALSPCVTLRAPAVQPDGTIVAGPVAFGQSLCVLTTS
ncbi:MAG: class I SAM-dependent methyltransferase [Acidobacteriota bacterium]